MNNLSDIEKKVDKKFNLITENWIRVTSGSKVEEISLEELLVNSHKYTQISGEISLQDFAIFRLAVAVLRSAILNEHDSLTKDLWEDMWVRNSFDKELITSYLHDDYIYDRFYLIHPTNPFYQSQELEPVNKVGIKSSRNLVLDSPNEEREFITFRSGKAYDKGLTFPEAARWLIGSMSYDPCGAHSGSLGDPRVADSGAGKGRSYPKKTSLSLISGIQILGDNLFETLMLNNIPMAIEHEETTEEDLPIWELDKSLPPGPLYEVDGERTKPKGILQLLTWPSRRIKLFYDGEGNRITQCMICAGDAFDPTDTHNLEMMASYKEGQEEGTLTPYVQNPKKMFWQGYDSILSSSSYKQPLNVKFLGDMKGKVVPNRMYRLAITTGRHDSPMSSLLTDALYEVNPLPTNIINDPELEKNVIDALERIETARSIYWSYGRNCTLSIIEDKDLAKENANSFSDRFSDECEDIFYKWIEKMSSGLEDPIDDIINQLEDLLNRLALDNERRTHNPKAFIGTKDDKENVMSITIARNIMMRTFKKSMRNKKEDK